MVLPCGMFDIGAACPQPAFKAVHAYEGAPSCIVLETMHVVVAEAEMMTCLVHHHVAD